MSESFHISNAYIVNEEFIKQGDILIHDGVIEKIDFYNSIETPVGYRYIDASGLHLLPGVIDDQVHFREPGLTEKGSIASETKAAIAGGVTSFMEMPNTKPPVLTQELLEEKYALAAQSSMANYSFYMGVSNDNVDEVLNTPLNSVCGIKIFLGASTGNLLVDNLETLNKLFANSPHLIAVHCEDEQTIRRNTIEYKARFGDDAPTHIHAQIRDAEACYLSSSFAIELAKKHNTRLHILHLSTAKEMSLFENQLPLSDKRITSEVCIHHLWFSDKDYEVKGNLIKWNPSIKSISDRESLREALNAGHLDIVATDHAPHLLSEKEVPFFNAPSGGPMVQHSLSAMLTLSSQGIFPLQSVVRWMCHNPAILFSIEKRGFIREGYYADLVLVDINETQIVDRSNVLYKCGWSPMEGETMSASVKKTFVNGNLVYDNGAFCSDIKGMRLMFDRE